MTQENTAVKPVKMNSPHEIILGMFQHARDDMFLAEIAAKDAGLWHVAEVSRDTRRELEGAIHFLGQGVEP